MDRRVVDFLFGKSGKFIAQGGRSSTIAPVAIIGIGTSARNRTLIVGFGDRRPTVGRHSQNGPGWRSCPAHLPLHKRAFYC